MSIQELIDGTTSGVGIILLLLAIHWIFEGFCLLAVLAYRRFLERHLTKRK